MKTVLDMNLEELKAAYEKNQDVMFVVDISNVLEERDNEATKTEDC